MPVDWMLLAELPPNELQSRLQEEAGALMNGTSDEDDVLAGMPEPLRALWLIDWLDFEVCQGSLLAYLFNSHGRHARLAIDVLERMGAHRMADVLTEAADLHERATPEWQTRHDDLDAAGEHTVVTPYKDLPGADRLSQFTDEYWRAAEADDWGDKLNSYLSAQVRLLRDGATR